MKVLFADCDGVLNSERWFKEDLRLGDASLGLRSIDPVAVDMLREVLRVTGAMPVLTSLWRLSDVCVQTLRDAGLPITETTPLLRGDANRGEEIAAWLEAHPEVTCFAIVDDDPAAGDCGLRSRLVLTRWETGLQPEHCRQLIRLLGVAESATLTEA